MSEYIGVYSLIAEQQRGVKIPQDIQYQMGNKVDLLSFTEKQRFAKELVDSYVFREQNNYILKVLFFTSVTYGLYHLISTIRRKYREL